MKSDCCWLSRLAFAKSLSNNINLFINYGISYFWLLLNDILVDNLCTYYFGNGLRTWLYFLFGLCTDFVNNLLVSCLIILRCLVLVHLNLMLGYYCSLCLDILNWGILWFGMRHFNIVDISSSNIVVSDVDIACHISLVRGSIYFDAIIWIWIV